MQENKILERLSTFFSKEGFRKIYTAVIVESIGWAFDVVAENKHETIAIEFRKNEQILDIFLNKIDSITRHDKKLFIYVALEKTPRYSIIALLNRYGIGIIIIQRNRIFFLTKSKDFSKKAKYKIKIKKVAKRKPGKKRKKKYKTMHQINVFISSKQYDQNKEKRLKERTKITKIIRNIDRRHSVPISPCLIERVYEDDIQFKRKITKNMKKCHIFICALTEKYGDYVECEVKKALKIFKNKDFILLLKIDRAPSEFDKEQLDLIKYIEKHKNYIAYSGYGEFEDIINDYLLKVIGTLYEKNKSKSPFSFK